MFNVVFISQESKEKAQLFFENPLQGHFQIEFFQIFPSHNSVNVFELALKTSNKASSVGLRNKICLRVALNRTDNAKEIVEQMFECQRFEREELAALRLFKETNDHKKLKISGHFNNSKVDLMKVLTKRVFEYLRNANFEDIAKENDDRSYSSLESDFVFSSLKDLVLGNRNPFMLFFCKAESLCSEDQSIPVFLTLFHSH